MNYHLLSVQRTGVSENAYPKIQISGEWLTEMGFVAGSLVQAFPEPDGFVFKLFNENTEKEQDGSYIKVFDNGDDGTFFVTTGKYIYSTGLKMGDALVAKYEYGCVRVRKVSGNVRLIPVAKITNANTGESKPYVLMSGAWLNKIGFTPDTLVTMAAEPNRITLTAHDKEIIYRDIARHARLNKMRLFQIQTKGKYPLIKVTSSVVERSGFGLGDIFAAEYEHGSIRLQKFDPQRFGFPEDSSPGN